MTVPYCPFHDSRLDNCNANKIRNQSLSGVRYGRKEGLQPEKRNESVRLTFGQTFTFVRRSLFESVVGRGTSPDSVGQPPGSQTVTPLLES